VVYTTYVEDLASTQYDIVYDGSFLNVTKVTSGSILDSSTGTFYPVEIVHWGLIPPATQGRVRIINDLPGDGVGVNGSGYLAKVHFYVATSSCEASDINFSVNMTAPNLFDSGFNPILGVTWLNTSMDVFPCGGG